MDGVVAWAAQLGIRGLQQARNNENVDGGALAELTAEDAVDALGLDADEVSALLQARDGLLHPHPRDEIQDELVPVTRRRPFSNAGNSCYVNATMQALFAAVPIQGALAIIEGIPASTDVIDCASEALQWRPNDRALSMTLFECVSKPLDESVRPRSILSSFYDGSQRDASEFLHELVQPESAPRVCGLCTIKLKSRIMCAECPGIAHIAESADETLLCLSLLVRRSADGVLLPSVQECIYNFEQPEVLAGYAWCCDSCCSTLPHPRCFRSVLVPIIPDA